MEFKSTELNVDGKIARLTINRPKSLNALNSNVIAELKLRALEIEANEEVRVVVLAGSGEKAFVAGADISEMQGKSTAEALKFTQAGHEAFTMIEESEKVWVAAIQGYALGGGLELAMACDILIANKKARLGQPEINLGLIPGFGGTIRLPLRVGNTFARELILTGRQIKADEALDLGLLNYVFSDDEFEAKLNEYVELLAKNSPVAMSAAKRSIMSAQWTDFDTAKKYEISNFALLFNSEDTKEGLSAFVEKRKPDFKGK